MAHLTINLNDPADVSYGISQLTLAQQRLTATVTPPEEESDEDLSRAEIIGLLSTKTGEMLIIPFVERVPAGEGRTLAEIAEFLADVPVGADPQRKAHSLIAGLGRWETPRNIQIFESMGGKPGRYRMNERVWNVLNDELNARAARAVRNT
ncbi:MAG: hypothetical protein K8U57_27640 [Planctomycetes bacterium]|nr:hypothetical protein [Planctomycetota bacterium]